MNILLMKGVAPGHDPEEMPIRAAHAVSTIQNARAVYTHVPINIVMLQQSEIEAFVVSVLYSGGCYVHVQFLIR